MKVASSRNAFAEGRVLLSTLGAHIVAGGHAADRGPLVVYRVDSQGSLDEQYSTPSETGGVCALAPYFSAANQPSAIVVEPINNAVAAFALAPIAPEMLVHTVGSLVLACAISPDGKTMCVACRRPPPPPVPPRLCPLRAR